MRKNNNMPDSYLSADIKPWETTGHVSTLTRFFYGSFLKYESDFEKMSFCSFCGRPLQWELNRMTGGIERMPCAVCTVFLPMNEEEKSEYIAWLKSL